VGKSIGKGYYELAFSSIEDMKRVRSTALWNLNPGILKLFAWSKDFNPSAQKLSSAQVWLKIYSLAQEYWRPKIIFAILPTVLGHPYVLILLPTSQYVRVLVDMDLSQPLRYKVLVERQGYAFFVDLEYENIPDFCTHCKKIGHHVGICKRIHPMEHEEKKERSTKEQKSRKRN
jgi:hypothetical protein